MSQLLKDFLADDDGQDLIEYSLLMAFVALASAALFLGAGKSISRHLEHGEQPVGSGQHSGLVELPRETAGPGNFVARHLSGYGVVDHERRRHIGPAAAR
jgi:Flp pilus assembly pilin Flp